MRSVTYLPQLLTVFIVSAAAAAQSPWGFPLDRQFPDGTHRIAQRWTAGRSDIDRANGARGRRPAVP